MVFRIERAIVAELERVEGALLAPGTLARLPAYAPLVGSAELLDRRKLDGELERTVRYRAALVPDVLARFAPRGAGEWLERTRWNPRAHAGAFRIEPCVGPDLARRFAREGTYRLEPLGPAATRRAIEGRLHVAAPAVGAAVERAWWASSRGSSPAKRGCSATWRGRRAARRALPRCAKRFSGRSCCRR